MKRGFITLAIFLGLICIFYLLQAGGSSRIHNKKSIELAKTCPNGCQAQNANSYTAQNFFTGSQENEETQPKVSPPQIEISTLTEADLLSQLDKEGRARYYSLSQEGRDLALELAKRGCHYLQPCKGSDDNTLDCYRTRACQGSTKEPLNNMNIAVELAEKYMKEKEKMVNEKMLRNGMNRRNVLKKIEKISKMTRV